MGETRGSKGQIAAGELHALTGLRGVAAAYVVLYHMLQDTPATGLMIGMVRHGYLAVDLFFVLSGFVLALVHGQDVFDPAGYKLFLRKRLARIYPLYVVVTATTLVLMALGHVAVSPGRLAVNVALLQGWGLGTSIVGPAWSLSAECAAYLLFPLLAALLLWGSRAQAIVCTLVAFCLLAAISLGGPHPRSGPLDLYQSNTVAPLVRCLCGFVLGLAAFRLHQSGCAQRLSGRWTSAGLGIVMLMLLAWPAADLLIVALMIPFIAALAGLPEGVAARILASAPLHRLGLLSFSIYLVHFQVREWFRPLVAARLEAFGLPHIVALATATACAATLGIAILTYRLIERPARTMVRDRLHLASSAS